MPYCIGLFVYNQISRVKVIYSLTENVRSPEVKSATFPKSLQNWNYSSKSIQWHSPDFLPSNIKARTGDE